MAEDAGDRYRPRSNPAPLPPGSRIRHTIGYNGGRTGAQSRRLRREVRVPEICRFFGVIIRMFAEPGAPHNVPHFHAYHQNESAIFSVDAVELLGGGLPRKERRLV
jgi:hypothetical protein